MFGARPLVPAPTTDALAWIAAAIDPWHLPADLTRLWHRVIREPLGVTHTIAAMRRAGVEGRAEGRIAGTVVRLAFVEGGYLVLVDDGSDTLDVWCPLDTTRWGLVHGGRFELAVRLEPAATALATAVRPLDR